MGLQVGKLSENFDAGDAGNLSSGNAEYNIEHSKSNNMDYVTAPAENQPHVMQSPKVILTLDATTTEAIVYAKNWTMSVLMQWTKSVNCLMNCLNFCPAAMKLHCPSIIYVYYRSQMLVRARQANRDLYLSLGPGVTCLRHNPRWSIQLLLSPSQFQLDPTLLLQMIRLLFLQVTQ